LLLRQIGRSGSRSPFYTANNSEHPLIEYDELKMSIICHPPHNVFGALIKSGLIQNYGARQKNPKRVAAALRHHASARRAKRIANEALAPPSAPPQRRPGFKPIGTRMYDRVVPLMLPGHWYSRGDLAHAAGLGVNGRGTISRMVERGGLLVRAPNPAAGKGTPTRPEPRWLYRLTPKGERLGEMCRLLA
jgi:hypothetical protein